MNGYEQRLATDKAEIRRRLVAMGEQVRGALGKAVEALLRQDGEACSRLVLSDLPINRESRSINRAIHAFIARHLPSGGHLRFVSSVLQMNLELERIGDYAVTIAREGVQLSSSPPEHVARQMRELQAQSGAVLGQALLAFAEQDVDLARATKPQTKSVEHIYGRMVRDLLAVGEALPLADAFALLTVFHRLARVSDRAKNVCEETLFELTGETKPPKQYRILFADARDTLVAPLAVALARKAFPESGAYSSGGLQPGGALAPELSAFAEELALDLDGLAPTPLPKDRESLERFHVIVGVAPDARRFFAEVPYATVFLQWDLPKLADAAPEESLQGSLRELCQALSHEIHDLMVLLRGEEAN